MPRSRRQSPIGIGLRIAGKVGVFVLLFLLVGLAGIFGYDEEGTVRRLAGEDGVRWLREAAPSFLTHDLFRSALVVLAVIAILAMIVWWLFVRAPWGSKNEWARRDQLELYVIACRSLGKKPKLPVNKDPQNSRLRLLKDAANDGHLKTHAPDGQAANMMARVRLADLARISQMIV